MTKLDDRILSLETRLKKIKALRQRTQARIRAQAKIQKRKDDTRRLILQGAVFEHLLDREPNPIEMKTSTLKEILVKARDEHLTEDYNRTLFGLPNLPPVSEDTEE